MTAIGGTTRKGYPMEDTYSPKHRRQAGVRTEPRVQPVPRHAGEYVAEDRMHERLGADGIEWGELLHDVCVKPRRVLQGLS